MIYCEHGNQLDPANTVEDYHDPLDTPLGHHVVMDFTRRIAPYGEISPGLDLSEIKMVYPLVAIPAWIASRYFYNLAGKAARYLLVPLLVAYAVYKLVAFLISSATNGQASLIFGSYRELPHVHQILLDTLLFLLLIVGIFGVFFLVARHDVRKTLRAVSPGGRRTTRLRRPPKEGSGLSSLVMPGRRWTPRSIPQRPTSLFRGTPTSLR